MNITDKKALRWIKIANCDELRESIDSYPEDERGGRDDLQFLADEVSYRTSLYTEGGTSVGEDYEEAVEFLRESNNGKRMVYYHTMPPVPKYTEIGLQNKVNSCKKSVNEYKRLISLEKRLKDLGYTGRWS